MWEHDAAFLQGRALNNLLIVRVNAREYKRNSAKVEGDAYLMLHFKQPEAFYDVNN